MNLEKLKAAEAAFLGRYPGGFSNPVMMEMGKKHKGDRMNKAAQERFAPDCFEIPERVVEAMVKTVSQSTMVSLFEKPKFRELAASLGEDEKALLSQGLYEFLHGDQAAGFHLMNGLLQHYKLAKWSLLTIIPVYYRPEVEVFVKPTTAKGIISHFELTCRPYSPKPSFAFYKEFRDEINHMKTLVDPCLDIGNAAFNTFLMLGMEELGVGGGWARVIRMGDNSAKM